MKHCFCTFIEKKDVQIPICCWCGIKQFEGAAPRDGHGPHATGTQISRENEDCFKRT